MALVNYIHRDLVEQRKWISEDDYKEGLALAQLSPGPLAAQLGIYIGFIHYRLLGATLAGVSFVLPSFIMVVLIGMAYQAFGGLPWMQAVFYGVGAAVIGIITISSYKLTVKSIGAFSAASLRNNWMLWTFFITGAVLTYVTQTEMLGFFVLTGVVYMLVKAPPAWAKRNNMANVLLLGGLGFSEFNSNILVQIALFFSNAGAFVFGSGLA